MAVDVTVVTANRPREEKSYESRGKTKELNGTLMTGKEKRETKDNALEAPPRVGGEKRQRSPPTGDSCNYDSRTNDGGRKRKNKSDRVQTSDAIWRSAQCSRTCF